MLPVVTEYGTSEISVVGHYSRLGNLAHHSSSSRKEIRRRIGIGNTSFTAHRRLLFQNKTFTLQRSTELFTSLVQSQIAYGMESWLFGTQKDQHYFRSAMLRLF